jgi:predicted NAD/FAD-binding protein
VLERMVYEHPQYTPESLRAQQQIAALSDDRIAYAGAYLGWGFHEDGALSGVRAAASLGRTWDAPGVDAPGVDAPGVDAPGMAAEEPELMAASEGA